MTDRPAKPRAGAGPRPGRPAGAGEECPVSQYIPGQVWTYRSRPGEGRSYLTILRVEADPRLGEIVHIRVDGLAMASRGSPGGISRAIAHMPLSAPALDRSVVLQIKTVPVPEFAEGYRLWSEATAAGRGGIFAVPVDECIEVMERALNSSEDPADANSHP